ncbi:MAG: GNAT family N-acetyltransferase [Phycisphaerae bacterium]
MSVEPSPPITIRAASAQDAPVLAPFAERVFRRTFERDPAHSPANMALHVSRSFSVAQLSAELARAETWYFVAERAGELLGYVKLERGPTPACVTGPSPIELARLYVDHAWHGRGVASRLMDHAFEHARRQGAQTIWLGVWRDNHRARRFYEKRGFVRVGEHPFLFGLEQQTDEVYARLID